MKIKAGILGGAGYTGGETLRLLLLHPGVELVFVHSKSQTGKPLYSTHKDCFGLTDLNFTDKLNNKIDVLFLCLGHGESKKWLTANSHQLSAKIKIIDLSQDFRHTQNAVSGKRKFIYGLPELNKKAIQNAENIANPGCFATCIQLALLPLAAHHKITADVHVSAITGSTGAGQSLSETSHFSWRQNNVSPYKIFEHQHLKEINESLVQLHPAAKPYVKFVPYRGAFARGILATVYFKSDLSGRDATEIFQSCYKGSPFVHIAPFEVDVKQVVNTNNCFLSVNKIGTELAIVSAIDNLLKGASGQAVQNMNLMFGIDETTGLKLKPSAF
jgi:N-acetyl-gamma-glutamyl-phosphate reductase